jgi:hypothetical protein
MLKPVAASLRQSWSKYRNDLTLRVTVGLSDTLCATKWPLEGLFMFSFTVRRLIGASAVVCLAASAVLVGSVAVPGQILALSGAQPEWVAR